MSPSANNNMGVNKPIVNNMKSSAHPNIHVGVHPSNNQLPNPLNPQQTNQTSWTMEEHVKFIECVKKYGQTVVQSVFPYNFSFDYKLI